MAARQPRAAAAKSTIPQLGWDSVRPAPVILITGPETLLAERATKLLRDILRTEDPSLGKLGQCPILARLSRPPYRWYAWVNNFADAPNANVVKLISSANEPS